MGIVFNSKKIRDFMGALKNYKFFIGITDEKRWEVASRFKVISGSTRQQEEPVLDKASCSDWECTA